MASGHVLTLLFTIFEIIASQQQQQQHDQTKSISLGSSLSPSNQHRSWNSSSGRFQFGFYQQDAGFSVGIWLFSFPEITIVWTANRDYPPVSSTATLTLTRDGKLILKTEGSKIKIIAITSEPASSASMLDSGNFVLYNNHSDIIWSSFQYPTDTLLGGQSLCCGNELFSRVSETNSSTGRFRLKMQADGNLVLYPTNTKDRYTESYWATGSNGNGQNENHLYVSNTGGLLLLNGSYPVWTANSESSFKPNSSNIYRATVGHDGILRFFSHYLLSDDSYNTSLEWQQPDDLCLVKTFCGLNSYCTLYDDQPRCRCLPGTDVFDTDEMSSGCERNFVDEKCRGTNISAEYNMTSMEKITWDDYPYFKADMSEEECRKSCLEDCECDAVLYGSNNCRKQKLPLKSARRVQGKSSSSIAYFKIGKRNITIHDNDANHVPAKPTDRITSKKAIILALIMTVAFVTASCAFLAISGVIIFKYRVVKYKWLLENGSMCLTDDLTLRSFSYNELKKATNGFKEELGKGSFGAVYKGTLYKGENIIAVKRLEKMVTEGVREFRAEMHVIGRTHHKNLVRLLGYCTEGSNRLLVYEYMSNGSLADLIFHGVERSPTWNGRVRIALDVARGILYLHDECEAPIIHCDIKPQNILIDEFGTAKVSDFGLAKLLMPDQTRTFTLIRGTRGYLAPEWYKNTPISVKADVYSYGVVLLEIICCRRNMVVDPSKLDEIVLINWVYKCFIEGELNKLDRGQEVYKKTFEDLVKVGLWCVQDEAPFRPCMRSVVMMLEGIIDIPIPPCPTSSSG